MVQYNYVSRVPKWVEKLSFCFGQMALDVQSSKKKSKKDKKRKERPAGVPSQADLAVDEADGAERRRKKRKRELEREGALGDGAFAPSHSLFFRSADLDDAICRCEKAQA
jgi:hypothetical protein